MQASSETQAARMQNGDYDSAAAKEAVAELAAVRLEVDVSHRALALLRLQRDSALEDVDISRSAWCTLGIRICGHAGAAPNSAPPCMQRLRERMLNESALEEGADVILCALLRRAACAPEFFQLHDGN